MSPTDGQKSYHSIPDAKAALMGHFPLMYLTSSYPQNWIFFFHKNVLLTNKEYRCNTIPCIMHPEVFRVTEYMRQEH